METGRNFGPDPSSGNVAPGDDDEVIHAIDEGVEATAPTAEVIHPDPADTAGSNPDCHTNDDAYQASFVA